MIFHSLKQHAVFLVVSIAALAIYGAFVYHQYSKSDMVAYVAPSPTPLPVSTWNGTSAITVSIDTSGNVGISGGDITDEGGSASGNVSVGSSVYGPTSATVNGDLTITDATWNGTVTTSH